MTQNPYAQNFPGAGGGMFPGDTMPPEQRTSALAITSLVLGILSLVGCCLTGVPLGVPAGLIGAIALVRIGSSQGRLGGRGLAIGGIVTGTIGLVLQVVMFVAAGQLAGMMNSQAKSTFSTIEGGDSSAVASVMSTSAMAQVDETRLKAFRAEYQKQVGTFQDIKPGLNTAVSNYVDVIEHHEKLFKEITEGGSSPWTSGGVFSQGEAYIIFLIPERQRGNAKMQIENVIVIPKSNRTPIWLIPPPATPGSGTAPAAPAPPSDPKSPSDPKPAGEKGSA